MPRKSNVRTPLDEVEDEILFTQAAIGSDPDAEDLLPLTESWLERLDARRAQERELRRRVANVDAARIVANARLDAACVAFSDELHLEVGKDGAAPRFAQFFNVSVHRFVRTSLGRQITAVRAWVQSSDPVLQKHKPVLDRWGQQGR